MSLFSIPEIIGGRQPESNLPGNGCRPQPGLKPGRATGRDCLPLNSVCVGVGQRVVVADHSGFAGAPGQAEAVEVFQILNTAFASQA